MSSLLGPATHMQLELCLSLFLMSVIICPLLGWLICLEYKELTLLLICLGSVSFDDAVVDLFSKKITTSEVGLRLTPSGAGIIKFDCAVAENEKLFLPDRGLWWRGNCKIREEKKCSPDAVIKNAEQNITEWERARTSNLLPPSLV
ncbi:hypothetical protein VNO80_08973 [Phaseolus coccineus]|uniref:Uncharacterized protein n=1 Tax=Phaseolus coccineus TaxID=3886 RepID=A0AAN9NAR0_PHACN